jgi:hypothetical protein
MIGVVAGNIWAVKWTVLACLGLVVYLNWQTISKHI